MPSSLSSVSLSWVATAASTIRRSSVSATTTVRTDTTAPADIVSQGRRLRTAARPIRRPSQMASLAPASGKARSEAAASMARAARPEAAALSTRRRGRAAPRASVGRQTGRGRQTLPSEPEAPPASAPPEKHSAPRPTACRRVIRMESGGRSSHAEIRPASAACAAVRARRAAPSARRMPAFRRAAIREPGGRPPPARIKPA